MSAFKGEVSKEKKKKEKKFPMHKKLTKALVSWIIRKLATKTLKISTNQVAFF